MDCANKILSLAVMFMICLPVGASNVLTCSIYYLMVGVYIAIILLMGVRKDLILLMDNL